MNMHCILLQVPSAGDALVFLVVISFAYPNVKLLLRWVIPQAARYMVLMLSVGKSGAGARLRVLPRLCLRLAQQPSSRSLARGSPDNLTVHAQVYFNSFQGSYLQIFFFFFLLSLFYERIIVCPSICLQKEKKKPTKLKLWPIILEDTEHGLQCNKICYKICFPTTSSYLRCLFPMGSFLKLMQWLWLCKTNLNFATSWIDSIND